MRNLEVAKGVVTGLLVDVDLSQLELETVRCDLCGSHEYDIDECVPLTGRGGRCIRLAWVFCSRCGLRYLNPRPTPAVMHLFYTRDYAERTHHRRFFRPAKEKILRRFRPLVVRLTGKDRNRILAAACWPLTRKVNALLDPTCFTDYRRGWRVLDVGAGMGQWISMIETLCDVEAYGVERDPYSQACGSEAGNKITPGTIRDLPEDWHGTFDYVQYRHVLEHVSCPSADLDQAYRLLRPGGKLGIEVPNADGFLYNALRYYEDTPVHLYGFSPKTLARLVQGAGFQVDTVRFIGDAIFVDGLRDALVKYLHSRQCGEAAEARSLFANRRLKLGEIASFLKETQASANIFLIAKKPIAPDVHGGSAARSC